MSVSRTPLDTAVESPPFGSLHPLDPAAARKRGFPGAVSTSTALAPREPWSAPAPVPQRLVRDRRSSRWLALAALALLITGAYLLYDRLYGQGVYGLTVGRVQRVSAPWSGTLLTIAAREGDELREGEVVGSLENAEVRHQIEEIQDELAIQRATLDAAVADVRIRSQLNGDRYRKALAEFYELWGTYLEESARMEVMQARLHRYDNLPDKRVMAEESVESLRLELQGQTVKVEKLRVAVQQLRTRAEETKRDHGNDEVQLRPIVARIESLQEQLKRLRAQSREGDIRAPISGRVVKVHRYAGEHVAEGECLLEILANGTLHPVIYVSDRQTLEIAEGQRLQLEVMATGEIVDCTVRRMHDRYEDIPDTLRKFYRFEGRALPVELDPVEPQRSQDQLRLGGLVRMTNDASDRLNEQLAPVLERAGELSSSLESLASQWHGTTPSSSADLAPAALPEPTETDARLQFDEP